MSQQECPKASDLLRLLGVALGVLLLLAVLVLQFYKIQILEGAKWKRIAHVQHHHVVTEPYRRGLFYSNGKLRPNHPRQPRPLVMDVPKFHLYADPRSIPESCREDVVRTLATVCGLSGQEAMKVRTALGRASRSRKLVLWQSVETRDRLLAWWGDYARSHKLPRNSLFFVQDYRRSYPFGPLLGQLLHTVREERDPKARHCVPTGGLELSLDPYLKGEDGRRLIVRSPRKSLDEGELVKPPRHGCDVYLTIDHHIQALMEEEIRKAVVKAEAKSGWAVMMDPRTGEIWAWAQYPFFEPSRYRDYFNDPRRIEDTLLKAITVPFEPGSTMKPMTMAIALQANLEEVRKGHKPLFSLDEKIATADGHFPGRSKPIKDLGRVHRYLNFDMGLQKSSNIYMGRVIQRVVDRLGPQWYRNALEQMFGFGIKTGVELPAESVGFLPKIGNARAWSKATPPSLAMGYNLLANTLQLVRSYAILANGGCDVTPTLIDSIVDPEGKVVMTTPRVMGRRLVEPEVIYPVVRGMKYVTKPGGTARRGKIPGYSCVGKTGTSEKVVGGVYSKTNHIAYFVGFAPADKPKFVLAVVVDEPAYKYIPGIGKNALGGVCAAPTFASIGLKTLQYLGVPPDDPDEMAWSQEVEALRKQYEQWNQ